MISKPEAYCPRCGGRFTVLDAIDVGTHAETVTYYGECKCGAANLTVTHGKITDITSRPPIEIPDYTDDEPEGDQEYKDYMAQ